MFDIQGEIFVLVPLGLPLVVTTYGDEIDLIKASLDDVIILVVRVVH